MEALSVKVELTILKPVTEVFSAVRHPRPFFVHKASGVMEENKTIEWQFEDFPKEISINVEKIVSNEFISFKWAGDDNLLNNVRFEFSALDKNSTMVRVTESGWPSTDLGREHSYRNNGGWMHMLCSLKAFLEYGVNLRKGSFVHMKGIVP